MNAYFCCQCSKVEPERTAFGWREVTAAGLAAFTMGDELAQGEVTLCSDECLRDWASARIERRAQRS